MGLGVDQNLLRCAAGHQLLQDPAVTQILGAGIQLSVGEGTGAAFPELHVGKGVQIPAGPKPLHILGPALHRPALLQYDGTQTGLRQDQRAEKTGRAGAHHDRRPGRQTDRRRRGTIRLRRSIAGNFLAAGPPQHGGFAPDLRSHRIYHADFFPGVHAAAQDVQGFQIAPLNF